MVVDCDKGRDLNAGLWAELATQFTDSISAQEMSWEREDNIWSHDWKSVTVAEAARRYAVAVQLPASIADRIKAVAAHARSHRDLRAVRSSTSSRPVMDSCRRRCLNTSCLSFAEGSTYSTKATPAAGDSSPRSTNSLPRRRSGRRNLLLQRRLSIAGRSRRASVAMRWSTTIRSLTSTSSSSSNATRSAQTTTTRSISTARGHRAEGCAFST